MSDLVPVVGSSGDRSVAAPVVRPQLLWAPQAGRQMLGAASIGKFTLFGGARKGGKSMCALGRHVLGVDRLGAKWNGLILRRYYKDFKDIRREVDELIRKGLPAVRVGGEMQENYIRFRGPFEGARITLTAVESLAKVDDFQGHQYTEITVDEAGTIPFVKALVMRLAACLVSPVAGFESRMFLTANPGGSGQMALKELFRIEDNRKVSMFADEQGQAWVFIPSRITDNAILMERDPSVERYLKSIQDPILRAAWLDGRWDVFAGQAFEIIHGRQVIDPVPVPEHAPITMTYDWGWGKPFSVGWWWWDNDGRRYRFAEWYGCGEEADTGLRMHDGDVARGILEREEQLGIKGRVSRRLAGRDVFAKKPDYVSTSGGGQAPSTAETFAQFGVMLQAGDDRDRIAKIRRMRELLAPIRDANNEVIGLPLLVAYSTCGHWVRTMSGLAMDPDRPEDVDSEQEDHIYDESGHIAMERRGPDAPLLPSGSRVNADPLSGMFRKETW